MLKQTIGAVIGARLAGKTPAVGGATGALAGAALPAVLARIGLPAVAVLAAGGYAAKRVLDRRAAARTPAVPPPTNPIPVAYSGDY